MRSSDYEKILDSMQETGVYVIREDDHGILYYNRRVREVTPEVELGTACHQLWSSSCENCPLLTIGDGRESRSISYNTPFGRVVDIVAVRVLWEDRIPAFVITLTPHMEVSSYIYRQLLRADLTRDTCEVVRLGAEDRRAIEAGGSLSRWFDRFLRSGGLHQEDGERLRTFTDLEHLRSGLRSGREVLTCTFRRRTGEGFRWNLLEVVPDFDYTDEEQRVIVHVKDVHDVLRESLEREEGNIRSQEITRMLGEENFGIYIIDLETGMTDPVRVEGRMQGSGRPQSWEREIFPQLCGQLHWEYQEEFERMFSLRGLCRARAAGERKVDMLCQRTVDGELYSYISVNAHLSQEMGHRQYIVLALQDTDERVRQELAHSQRDMQMAAILKCRYSVMNTIYLDSGLCERVDLRGDPGAQEAAVGDYAEHFERALGTVVREEDAEELRRTLSLEHIRQKALETDDYLEEVCQYRMRGEPVRWLEQHVVYSRQSGSVLVNILGRDVTREKSREAARAEKARETSDIIRSLSSMFFATYYVNLGQDTFQSVTQLREVGDFLGEQVCYSAGLRAYAEKFIHPDDQEEYLSFMSVENLRAQLSRERPYVAMEYRRPAAEGELEADQCGWIRATAVLVRADGQGRPLTALYAAQDVTESKQKEAREQRALQEACRAANHASAAKSDFLSRMSHDMRTPMNGIIGMTGIAAAHVHEPERVQDCLKKILVSSQHLLSLVNEVLDMSQIESGKIDLVEEGFRIPEMIADLAAIIRSPLQEKGHTLRIHPIELEHEAVLGDAARLQQVFVNILGNGIKYTPPGGLLEIEVREKESRERGCGCFDFIFRDNGIGMDEEFVKHIFEPFSRADDSRISTVEGTGLGMTIALNMIRRMGGDISVRSKLGVGSQFTVTLFLKKQSGEEARPPEEEGEVSFQGRRILLVEDNEINREIAWELLTDAGAEVECAENGQEALDRFTGTPPGYFDVILMDIQMPVMDGHGATRAIRALPREDGVQIPIIAMSANAFASDISASRAAGMNEHITKPLDVPRLLACLDFWLNGQGGR